MSKIDRFDAKKFIAEQIDTIRTVLDNQKALIACSGGVDSTICPTVSAVYFDITPKPPSSIEFE